MAGLSFSVRRRYVSSKRERLYTYIITFRKIHSLKLGLSLSSLMIISKKLTKTLFFKIVEFFFIKERVNELLKKINNVFYTFRVLWVWRQHDTAVEAGGLAASSHDIFESNHRTVRYLYIMYP